MGLINPNPKTATGQAGAEKGDAPLTADTGSTIAPVARSPCGNTRWRYELAELGTQAAGPAFQRENKMSIFLNGFDSLTYILKEMHLYDVTVIPLSFHGGKKSILFRQGKCDRFYKHKPVQSPLQV